VRPVLTPEDLQAAAFDAAQRVRAGEMHRAQAVDEVYDRAIGAGLVRRHGEDAVQAWISAPFSMVDHELEFAKSALDKDITPVLDHEASSYELDLRAPAQAGVKRASWKSYAHGKDDYVNSAASKGAETSEGTHKGFEPSNTAYSWNDPDWSILDDRRGEYQNFQLIP
jgi:hypothetical protein